MSDQHTLSFDRMRSMLMRAAEIRDSEQQQIFDSLDEIHARLATLDALGSMRKRLAELPDRTEVSVLAERLDETVAKLDAQDAALASVSRAVDSTVDRLAKPFAQLDGRLDGVAGRMEGIAGRMEGLDDKLGGLHKRLDDLDNRMDRHELRMESMPRAVTGPVQERLGGLDSQLDALTGRLDEVTKRLDGVDSSVGARPDTDALAALVERANQDSERRNAGQLDEAMATFAEIILGRGPSAHVTPMPAPRPAHRRGRAKAATAPHNGTTPAEVPEDPDDN